MVIATKLSTKTCNFNCKYCYQTPDSLVKEHPRDYDLEKVMEKMEELYNKYETSMTIHSGEPTALNDDDFEKLLKRQYEISGKSSIQTNGYKLDEYWDLFDKYNTHLGISYDGPGECNILRGFGDKDKRLEIADKIEENIYEAIDRDLRIGLISVIHRKNGIDNFDEFTQFLIDTGLQGRLNPVSITENIGHSDYELTMDELIDVYDNLYNVCKDNGLNFSPFRDMSNSLRDEGNVVCTFNNACDIYATESLIGITKDGVACNCIKTYHSDTIYPRLDNSRPEIRKQVLKETDCKGCKWFNYCQGGCPNNGIGDDWRRKDRYCELYKHLFEKIENNLNCLGITRVQNESCEHQHDGDYTDDIRHEDDVTVHLDSDINE